MRWLITYIRSCFCRHEWERLAIVDLVRDDKKVGYIWMYRCKKCGYVKKYKV